MPSFIGGSFAPPIDDAKLLEIRQTIQAVDPKTELGTALAELLRCFDAWWHAPESKSPLRAAGIFVRDKDSQPREVYTQALDPEIAAKLFDAIPWDRELDALVPMFNAIEDAPLRHAAGHLLWYARELTRDREPITRDKVLGE